MCQQKVTNDWSASVPACQRRLESGVKPFFIFKFEVKKDFFASENDAQASEGACAPVLKGKT
jgi:hypothetical protein